MTARCPVSGCEAPVPSRGVFCVDHHFQIPRTYTSLIFRVKFEAARTEDPERRAHLISQFHSYVSAAIGHLPATLQARDERDAHGS